MGRNKVMLVAMLLALLSVLEVFGQHRFEGVVYDATTGQYLSNVKILEEHSEKATITDSVGYFSFFLNQDRVSLKFSRMGYQPFGGQYILSDSPISVQLRPGSIEIEEIEINTGYQWIPRERITGSFVHLGEAELSRIPARSVLDKLDGIMPGLQFDNRSLDLKNNVRPVVTVRGMNTFSMHTSHPLIIVDDFPYEGDLADINPNDVESVTMLRDAGATSIWGARAGNGVLVINLKKPDPSGRASTSWSSDLSITERPDLYNQPTMSSSEFVDVEMFLYERGHYRSALTGSNAYRTVFSPVVQALYDLEKGRVDRLEVDRIIHNARNHDYRDEMSKHFYRNAINQRHHLSFSNRTSRHAMRVSVGMDKLAGVGNLQGEKNNKRHTFTLNHAYQITERLNAELNVYYSLSDNRTDGSIHYPLDPSGGKSALYPYARLFDDKGMTKAIPRALNPNFVDTVGSNVLLDWRYYPYQDMNHVLNKSRTSRMHPTLSLRYNPVSSLALEVIYSGDFQSAENERSYGMESYYVRDKVNRFTTVKGDQIHRALPIGDIISYDNSNLRAHKLRFQAKMDRHIFQNDRLSWIVGGEVSDVGAGRKAQTVYGYDPFLMLSIPVDHVSRHPLYLGGTESIPTGQSYGRDVQRLMSFYANASYMMYDRYDFSGSVRRDASNVFGAKSNERWNPLWSVGLSWNIAKEGFMEELNWVSQLRLRLTYGHSGNLGGGTTSDRAVITSVGTAQLTGLPAMIISSPPNPYLKWEQVQMNNYGLDFGVFGNIVTGSVEYYRKRVKDLISRDPLDNTTGFPYMDRNVAGIDGEGLEMILNVQPFQESFLWKTGVSLSYARDWVTAYKGAMSSSSSYVALGENSVMPVVGRSLVSVYSYPFAGLDPQTGDPLGYLNREESKDYSVMMRDSLHYLNYHGSARPLYFGFVNNTFQYRNISLFVNVAFRAGHYFRRNTISYSSVFNSWITHSDYGMRWQQPGDERKTNIPSMVYPANTARDDFFAGSQINVERGDVVRLQQVHLSYRFLSPLWRVRYLDVGIHTDNLGVLWKATNTERDPDYRFIPPSRRITMNLRVLF
jgi:TonB-linked SusC/RagA family outer membrane protein